MSNQNQSLSGKSGYSIGLCVNWMIVFSLVFSAHSYAAQSIPQKSRALLAEREHQSLVKMQQAVNDDQLALAIDLVKRFNQSSATPLAKALSQQLLGGVYQTQLDYPNALAAYEKSISYKGLPLSVKVALFERIHKLNYFLKDWQQATHWWLKWEKKARPQAQDYLLLSNAYRHQQKWGEARTPLLKAIALSEEPPQAWYKLLLYYEEQLGDTSKQVALLKKMLEKYPQVESYWLKLANLYIRSDKPRQASALLHSAFTAEILVNSVNINWLISRLAEQQNYLLAAQVMEEALQKKLITDGEAAQRQIVNLLILGKAHQRALVRILQNQGEAQKPSPYSAVLAKLYFEMGRWKEAYETSQNLPAEQLHSSLQWQLLMAVSSVNLAEKEQAKVHFENVLAIDADNKAALRWLQQL